MSDNVEMTTFGVVLANASASDRNDVDFYPTPHAVTHAFLASWPVTGVVWECACGTGSMSESLKSSGLQVISTDLNDFGYGTAGVNFLTETCESDWIITNPPFSMASQFIERAVSLHRPFAFLLKSQFWHALKRYKLFMNHPPEAVLPLTWRPDFLNGAKGGSPTMDCIWTVWGVEPARETIYRPIKRQV